ncbi:MAG: hypothetical protein NC489_44755 [Ruminococcus flavefaciens]|nr:hypothetical protein [Ruminococcus flavefaciens]
MKNLTLFGGITEDLMAKGLYPGILDVAASALSEVELIDSGWSVTGELHEEADQISLDVYAESTADGTARKIHLGTYRTRCTDSQALRTMEALRADFIRECSEYISQNPEDFPPH